MANKNLTLLALAVAALAVPASADAIELHEALPNIVGTSTNAITRNLPEGLGGGTLTCEKVMVKSEMTNSGPETLEGSGSSGTFTNCVQTDEAGKNTKSPSQAQFTN